MPLSKSILITGANGGLGRIVSSYFASKGFETVGVDRDQCDLGKPGALAEWCEKNESSLKSLAGAVHCAGGFRWQTVDAWKKEDLEFLISANFVATWNLFQALVPRMKKTGGRIVILGAHGALTPAAGMGPYAATKAAAHALVQAVSEETKDFDVQINAILPSVIDTPANRKDMPQADFKKWVTPEQIAQMAHYLVTEAPASVRGTLISMKGGV